MITWTGQNTSNSRTWYAEEKNYFELYKNLVEQGVISIENGDKYDELKMEVNEKTYENYLDDDNEYDYEKFIFDKTLREPTENEIKDTIESQDGSAYYQTFVEA